MYGSLFICKLATRLCLLKEVKTFPSVGVQIFKNGGISVCESSYMKLLEDCISWWPDFWFVTPHSHCSAFPDFFSFLVFPSAPLSSCLLICLGMALLLHCLYAHLLVIIFISPTSIPVSPQLLFFLLSRFFTLFSSAEFSHPICPPALHSLINLVCVVQSSFELSHLFCCKYWNHWACLLSISLK